MKKKLKIYFFYFWILVLIFISFITWLIIFIIDLSNNQLKDQTNDWKIYLGLIINFLILITIVSAIVRRRYKKDKIFEKSIVDFDLIERLLKAQKSIVLVFNKNKEIIWTNNPSFFRIFLNNNNYYHSKLNKILPNDIFEKIDDQNFFNQEKFFVVHPKEKIKYQFLVSQINKNTILFHENQIFYRFRNFFNENRSLFLILKIDHLNIGNLQEEITVEIEQKQIFPFVEFKLNQFFSKKKLLSLNLKKNEFVVFLTYKQLKKIQESNFNFLEKIKNSAKRKFKIDIIFSGGVYQGYDDVVQDEEKVIFNNFLLNDCYQKSIIAKNLAIARGGNQIVVTNANKKIKIYGKHKNESDFVPQLKKVYQSFLKKIVKYEKIIIVGHQNADLDVFGSGLALKVWLQNIFHDKKIVFVVEHPEKNTKEKIVKMLAKENQKFEKYFEPDWTFYNLNQFPKEKTALIIIDVNNHLFVDFSTKAKKSLKNIFIFDHHDDYKNFPECELKFIDNQISSASEIIINFLKIAEDENVELKISNFVYRLLLLGILIDTNNLQNNLGKKTINALSFLVQKKIDLSESMNEINMLKNKNKRFMERTETIKIKKDYLILKIFNKEINAVIASTITEDYLVKHDLKVIFTVLYNEKKQIFISARSKIDFDVQKICQKFGGGGSNDRAAAKLENEDVEKIIKKISQMIKK